MARASDEVAVDLLVDKTLWSITDEYEPECTRFQAFSQYRLVFLPDTQSLERKVSWSVQRRAYGSALPFSMKNLVMPIL